jgi:cytochrome oxidase Cu insertion factor (SCO1/SenC/PrrC family)
LGAVIVQETLSVGKPKLGGPFTLVDQDGRTFTDADLHGQWALLYFGFTHCPDICPEELAKMVEITEGLRTLPPRTAAHTHKAGRALTWRVPYVQGSAA